MFFLPVDLFNEGIDIPEVDCILFLRPTESATVFLQQLGRGLRLNTGKTNCLVLDFIGNQRREFRFDQRFRALFGGTRQQVTRQIESGITPLPGNCYFRLDKESKRAILENLKIQLQASRQRMASELRALAAQLQRPPSLTEFLAETHYDIGDVFKPSIGGWYSLLFEAQLCASPMPESDRNLEKRFQSLLHVDSVRRLRLYMRLTEETATVDRLPVLEKRMVEMLTFRLLPREAREGRCEWSEGMVRLRGSLSLRSEVQELCGALLEEVRLHSDEVPIWQDCALFLHRVNTLEMRY